MEPKKRGDRPLEDKKRPKAAYDLNKFRNEAVEVLGEQFWEDIAELIPQQGPRIDVYYTAASVYVVAEIPGLDSPDQIEISLQGQTLVIEGELPRLYPVTDLRITKNERFFGHFRRSLLLPKPVSGHGVSAAYSKGLLTVQLPIDEMPKQTNVVVDFSG